MDELIGELRELCAIEGRPLTVGERARTKIAMSEAAAALEAAREDSERLAYIERTFSGMTNRERYLPVQMIWGKGCNGRTLREACDKYRERDAAGGEPAPRNRKAKRHPWKDKP